MVQLSQFKSKSNLHPGVITLVSPFTRSVKCKVHQNLWMSVCTTYLDQSTNVLPCNNFVSSSCIPSRWRHREGFEKRMAWLIWVTSVPLFGLLRSSNALTTCNLLSLHLRCRIRRNVPSSSEALVTSIIPSKQTKLRLWKGLIKGFTQVPLKRNVKNS